MVSSCPHSIAPISTHLTENTCVLFQSAPGPRKLSQLDVRTLSSSQTFTSLLASSRNLFTGQVVTKFATHNSLSPPQNVDNDQTNVGMMSPKKGPLDASKEMQHLWFISSTLKFRVLGFLRCPRAPGLVWGRWKRAQYH